MTKGPNEPLSVACVAAPNAVKACVAGVEVSHRASISARLAVPALHLFSRGHNTRSMARKVVTYNNLDRQCCDIACCDNMNNGTIKVETYRALIIVVCGRNFDCGTALCIHADENPPATSHGNVSSDLVLIPAPTIGLRTGINVQHDHWNRSLHM